MKWVVKYKDKVRDLAYSTYANIFNNLSDLTDKVAAINNLKLFDKLASIEEIKRTQLYANAIKSTNLKRWITDAEKELFNNKIDNPVISNTKLDNTNEIQLYYNSNQGRFYVKINDKYRQLGGNIISYTVGKGTFSGNGEETRIQHNIHDSRNVGVTPSFVSIKPLHSNNQGRVGDMWVKKDNNFIYVGNTGSQGIEFQYIIFAPKDLG
jgi:hypothetical protein